jgi:hypothetical protein
MKLHHAAALALVGWALMIPPAKGFDIDTQTQSDLLSIPVWNWERVAFFDWEEQCLLARDKMIDDPNDPHPKYAAQLARCIPARSN